MAEARSLATKRPIARSPMARAALMSVLLGGCGGGDPSTVPPDLVLRVVWLIDGHTVSSLGGCPDRALVRIRYPDPAVNPSVDYPCELGGVTFPSVRVGRDAGPAAEATLVIPGHSPLTVAGSYPEEWRNALVFSFNPSCPREDRSSRCARALVVSWTLNGLPASDRVCPYNRAVRVVIGRQEFYDVCADGQTLALNVTPGRYQSFVELWGAGPDVRSDIIEVNHEHGPTYVHFDLHDESRPTDAGRPPTDATAVASDAGPDAMLTDAREVGADAIDNPDVREGGTGADVVSDSAVDAGPRTDGSREDAGVSTSCATRTMAGACMPGVDPGCDIVDVSIGHGSGGNPCAVFTDGSVRCWSQNRTDGVYLGNGTVRGCVVPGLVLGLTGVSRTFQGRDFLCAVRPSQAMPVWCWGFNNQQQFGVQAPSSSFVPMATPIPTGTLALGGGGSGLSVSGAGVVTAWGNNQYGQLGDGTTSGGGAGVAPHAVSLPGLQQLAVDGANGWVTCGVFTGGEVRCWGWGQAGHFGTARMPVTSSTQSSTPVVVPGITSAREVRISGRSACALRNDATLWCWGLGQSALAMGGGLTPTQVLDRVTHFAVSGSVVCAAREDGTLWCWGSDFLVGNGSDTGEQIPSPVAVAGLSGVRRVYAGLSTACAWLGGSDLRCWGFAPGAGTRESTTPVRVVW